MAKATRTAVVHVEFVDVETGLWCRDCALSTGARVWFTTTILCTTRLRSQLFCTEAGQAHTIEDA